MTYTQAQQIASSSEGKTRANSIIREFSSLSAKAAHDSAYEQINDRKDTRPVRDVIYVADLNCYAQYIDGEWLTEDDAAILSDSDADRRERRRNGQPAYMRVCTALDGAKKHGGIFTSDRVRAYNQTGK